MTTANLYGLVPSMAGIEALRKYREDNGLTQAALAKQLRVSAETIHRWEVGSRKPGKEALPVISEKTGIAPQELRPDLAEMFEAAPANATGAAR